MADYVVQKSGEEERYEDDYRAAAVPMLPVVVGRERTLDHMALYSLVTAGVSLLLAPWMGWIYLSAAVVLGAVLIGGAMRVRSPASQTLM